MSSHRSTSQASPNFTKPATASTTFPHDPASSNIHYPFLLEDLERPEDYHGNRNTGIFLISGGPPAALSGKPDTRLTQPPHHTPL